VEYLLLEHMGFWTFLIRDVTKFEFEFDNVRTLNVFNKFEFDEC